MFKESLQHRIPWLTPALFNHLPTIFREKLQEITCALTEVRLAAGVKTEVEFVGQLTSQCLHGRHERNDQNEDDRNENDERDDRRHACAHTPVLPTLERSFLPLKEILATSGNARKSFEAVL